MATPEMRIEKILEAQQQYGSMMDETMVRIIMDHVIPLLDSIGYEVVPKQCEETTDVSSFTMAPVSAARGTGAFLNESCFSPSSESALPAEDGARAGEVPLVITGPGGDYVKRYYRRYEIYKGAK